MHWMLATLTVVLLEQCEYWRVDCEKIQTVENYATYLKMTALTVVLLELI